MRDRRPVTPLLAQLPYSVVNKHNAGTLNIITSARKIAIVRTPRLHRTACEILNQQLFSVSGAMVPSPRKRLASPRKRLPPSPTPTPTPTPFTQTWHETDTAHLDPSALPVARIPRGWERKREVKQVSDGKAKSIWRRVSLRSSNVQEDEMEEEDHEAQSRAVKRRQRMSPKAMEKMRGKKRGFQGTQWDRSKSVLPRTHLPNALH
jgi:hypothetical protein